MVSIQPERNRAKPYMYTGIKQIIKAFIHINTEVHAACGPMQLSAPVNVERGGGGGTCWDIHYPPWGSVKQPVRFNGNWQLSMCPCSTTDMVRWREVQRQGPWEGEGPVLWGQK